MQNVSAELWSGSDAYEQYMGRWSRQISPLFLDWMNPTPDGTWIDIGCGTGVLSSDILNRCTPRRVEGVDPSEAFVKTASARITDPRFQCRHGGGELLPYDDNEFTAAVSGLVLNFVGDKEKAAAEMCRVVKPGGNVGLYVWDYAGHMQIMRYFFDVAKELDAGAVKYDDGVNAPICRPEPLIGLFENAGLQDVQVQALDIPAAFQNFEDYWTPFLGGTGSAPKYCTSLTPNAQARLREKLQVRLPTGPDGEILLAIRAWGVKGRIP